MHRNRQDADDPKDRTQLVKYAVLYLAVAGILLVTHQAAKNSMPPASQTKALSNLRIDLSIARGLEPKRLGGNAAAEGTYTVRFRLANKGNQPIFYPVFPNTNRPMGHLVYRIARGSDWRLLSVPERFASAPAQLNAGVLVAWVEMPPGGWIRWRVR